MDRIKKLRSSRPKTNGLMPEVAQLFRIGGCFSFNPAFTTRPKAFKVTKASVDLHFHPPPLP